MGDATKIFTESLSLLVKIESCVGSWCFFSLSRLLDFVNLKFEKFVVFGLKFWLEAQMSIFRTSLLAENRVKIFEAFLDCYAACWLGTFELLHFENHFQI